MFFQEDLSRLRRKLEKQKKVEMYTDADEILQEEINQYKVREKESCIVFIHTSFCGKDVTNTPPSGATHVRLLSTHYKSLTSM